VGSLLQKTFEWTVQKGPENMGSIGSIPILQEASFEPSFPAYSLFLIREGGYFLLFDGGVNKPAKLIDHLRVAGRIVLLSIVYRLVEIKGKRNVHHPDCRHQSD